MNKILKRTIIISLLLLFLLSPVFVFAQNSDPDTNCVDKDGKIIYCPLAPLPGVETGENLGSYLDSLFSFLIGLAAILAVFMIALGGFWYISSDSITGKQDGRGFINNALLGLILALVAWLILNTINPNLLNLNFDPGSEDYDAPEGGTPNSSLEDRPNGR